MKRATLFAAVLAAGMLSIVGQATAAAPAWKALAVTGPTHLAPYTSERQTVTLSGSTGSYTLTFGGDTTGPIPRGAAPKGPGGIEEALNALPSISAGGGSVDVTLAPDAGPASPTTLAGVIVTFNGGPLAGTDVPAMTALGSGGTTVSVSPTPSGQIAITPTNIGGVTSDGSPIVAQLDLPAGITPLGTSECPATGQHVTCSRSLTLRAGELPGTAFLVPIVVELAASPPPATVSLSGGGAVGNVVRDMPIVVSAVPAEAGIQDMWAGAFDADGNPYTQAGGHPHTAGTGFRVNTIAAPNGQIIPAGDIRDLDIDPPAGFVGNPLVTDLCPDGALLPEVSCAQSRIGSAKAIVMRYDGGNLDLLSDLSPVLNRTAPSGYAAKVWFRVGSAEASAFASVRPDDFGVRLRAPLIPNIYRVYGAVTVLEGAPATADGKAFLTNPTECTGLALPTFMSANSWQDASVFSDPVSDDAPPVTGCGAVPFDPSVAVAPSSLAADSASGLEFDVDAPQDGLLDPEAIAPSHLKDVVVDLPAGVAVNPSGATGLKGCSDVQMAPGTKTVPSCPDGSKLGAVEATSPLVDHAVGGTMYLGTPKSTDPMSGEMLRLWVVARDDETGTMIKLPGSATADPATGKLTATFENNPRVPVDHLTVKLRGGDRGLLAMPQDCGTRSIGTSLSPWSGNAPVSESSEFDVTGDCSLGFAPGLAAGMSSSQARGSGTFAFKFTRPDGQQWIDGLTAKLPQGLLASVKDVPLCSDAQAAAGACPAGSRIGTVDATAGSGDPFVLEQKGSAYLTEGYKGCAYGLAVVVPVVAGPFDGASPETDLGDIVVRQAVCVDRSTAEVSAISDPLPTIWHGIPVRVRSVTVSVDRPGFMLNPSDCTTKQVGAAFDSNRGATAGAATPFNTSGCASLPFKPTLSLALTGKRQVTTGKHPGINATVTQQGVGEAGIEKAEVRLPKSLALDPNNAQALCEFADGTKPDLENHCPKGSVVGRARAKTPLLRNDLVGNVYFVKNIRIDSKTGNQIRTLPMIIVALRGEIAVNLKGESSTTKSGKLVNTFASVPDAPISQFNLNINGGSNGIIAVTRTRKAKINLCAGRHTAETDMDAQNGRRHDFDVRMKTPCTKRQVKNAKRAVAKARKARR